jgi:hypothetical protein
MLSWSFKKAFTAKRAEGENLTSIVATSSGLTDKSVPSVINGNVVRNINLTVNGATQRMSPCVAGEMRKAFRRQKVTDLFVYLADHAFQERLVAFTMAAEEPDHARI